MNINVAYEAIAWLQTYLASQEKLFIAGQGDIKLVSALIKDCIEDDKERLLEAIRILLPSL